MKEYWIEVKGHPRYRVSTMGRVKCLDWKRTGKERLCKLSVNSNGYLRASIDGVKRLVHRLVATSFIPNPQKKPEVEHKDTRRDNNRVDNLKWTTHRSNSRNPLTRKHMRDNSAMLGKLGAEHPKSVSIVQLSKDGQFIRRWGASKEVERELGIHYSGISDCCRGKKKTAGGFRWVYATDYNPVKHSISEINPLF